MQTLKRSIVLQIVFYTGFFFYGLDYILRSLITRDTLFKVLELFFLSLIVIGGIVWYFLTKKDDLAVISHKDTSQIKIVLYVIAGALILGLFASFFKDYETYFLIISGAVMSLGSLYGLYLSIKIYIANE